MVKVAVTTTSDAAPKLSRALASVGLEPVPLPCIRVLPGAPDELARLRGAARDADWLLLMSPRAVHTLWPNGGMPPTPAACVGPTTAGTCEAAGGNPVVVGTAGAEGLVDEIAETIAGRLVFFPHAAASDQRILDRLRSICVLTEGAAYRTETITPEDTRVEAVVFTSPSTVRGWLSARPLDGLVVAALGTTTATELRSHGYEPQVMPPTPDVVELAHGLARCCETRRWID